MNSEWVGGFMWVNVEEKTDTSLSLLSLYHFSAQPLAEILG